MNHKPKFKINDIVYSHSMKRRLTIKIVYVYNNRYEYYFENTAGYLFEEEIELDKYYYRKEKLKKILNN